jgi:hypothetical protein
MTIISYLTSEQIQELEKVTRELYGFGEITESLSLKSERINTVKGSEYSLAPSGVLGWLFGSRVNKSIQTNKNNLEIDFKEIIEEQEEQYMIDKYVDYSSSKIIQTEAFNALSGLVKENIKSEIGDITWNKLEEKSKLFITTAEVLREFLLFFNDKLDYSPPTLNYCKAVENELNEKLLFPFKQNFYNNNQKLKNKDYESRLSFVISNKDEKLTLGNHVYIIKRLLFSKQLTNIELEYKRFIMIVNPRSLENLNQRINTITKYYRNPSGHTEVMDQNQCLDCRNYIINKDGVLPGIINNFKIINIIS